MRISDNSGDILPLNPSAQQAEAEELKKIDCPNVVDLPSHCGMQSDISKIMAAIKLLPKDVPKVLQHVKKEVDQHKNIYVLLGKGQDSTGIIRSLIKKAIGRQ